MANSNEYMREYMAQRYERRRAAAIDQLGGICVTCGSTDDLQFDHIDPSTKSFTIAKKMAGVSEKRLQAELVKCQLLCQSCHERKTLGDLGQQSAKGTHGTLSSLRHCKPPCTMCAQAKREYMQEYAKTYKRKR